MYFLKKKKKKKTPKNILSGCEKEKSTLICINKVLRYF